MAKPSEPRRSRGTILSPDDLCIGSFVTVHHWHRPIRGPFLMGQGTDMGMGAAFRIKAIELPYIVVQPIGHPDTPPTVLDIRAVSLMQVSEAFAKAQQMTPPRKTAKPAASDDDIPF